ncbi:unnamed protein product [Enterobius vermicularis]|uniref:Rx_N domain-containing protein n=1 Tax=Enterobius vermicularis TaxID=51028 RepID=A0A0N4UU28_ENTVE|nr:unnamed protein product [Enterobius vermicularis]
MITSSFLARWKMQEEQDGIGKDRVAETVWKRWNHNAVAKICLEINVLISGLSETAVRISQKDLGYGDYNEFM